MPSSRKTLEKVTRDQLIHRIKDKDERLTNKLILHVLGLFNDVIVESLQQGKEVILRDYIKIYPYAKGSHRGYVPYKQEFADFPNKVVTKAELGKKLKDSTKGLDYEEIKKHQK